MFRFLLQYIHFSKYMYLECQIVNGLLTFITKFVILWELLNSGRNCLPQNVLQLPPAEHHIGKLVHQDIRQNYGLSESNRDHRIHFPDRNDLPAFREGDPTRLAIVSPV